MKSVELCVAETPANQGRAVLGGVTLGNITPNEAATLMQAVTAQARVVEVEELAERLEALERVLASSRAQCTCILVASSRLFEPEYKTPRRMQLANALGRYSELARVAELR